MDSFAYVFWIVFFLDCFFKTIQNSQFTFFKNKSRQLFLDKKLSESATRIYIGNLYWKYCIENSEFVLEICIENMYWEYYVLCICKLVHSKQEVHRYSITELLRKSRKTHRKILAKESLFSVMLQAGQFRNFSKQLFIELLPITTSVKRALSNSGIHFYVFNCFTRKHR